MAIADTDALIRMIQSFFDEYDQGPPRLYPEVELLDQKKADASYREAEEMVRKMDRERAEWLARARPNADRVARGLEPVGEAGVRGRGKGKRVSVKATVTVEAKR
jgi:hypothetical protein